MEVKSAYRKRLSRGEILPAGRPALQQDPLSSWLVGPKEQELHPAVSQWIRNWIAQWFKEDPSRTNTALAEEIGISKAQLGDIRNKGRNPGLKTAMGLAKKLKLSLEDLEALAVREQAAAVAREEPEDRYPLRAEAIVAVGKHVLPEAIEEVRSYNDFGSEGQDVFFWIEQLRAADRRARARQANPAAAARAEEELAAESARKTARMLARMQAGVAELGPAGFDPMKDPQPARKRSG